ncbi:MAG: PQQ-dependent sugar dehydrogenase [Phycisphaerae bacterium]|nr:PQQ-dependent sugar dehydrogenase [Phycisphaerae bacterium]
MVLGGVLGGSTARADLPPGFQRETVASGFHFPLAIAFMPDGRPLVAEKCGRVLAVNGSVLQTVIQLPDVNCSVELGLLGMAVRADQRHNVNHLYLCYVDSALHLRVSRFEMNGVSAVLASEEVLWYNPQTSPGSSHHGGCIMFGPDGMLYVGVGEEFESVWSQDLSVARGKVLRIAPDGSIPADNPFVGVPGVEERVWAYGFRNPFRFNFDPLDGALYVSDVGSIYWEEVSRIEKGANAGWPMMEGPHCFGQDCSGLVAPIWSYAHGDPLLSPNHDAAIIAGPVYRGTQFPAAYLGSLFVTDFPNGWVRRLVLENGAVVGDHEFLPIGEASTVADLKVGPDGCLYYVRIYTGPSGKPALYRVRYTGEGNLPPTAVASVTPAGGPPPLVATCDASGSSDPDDGPRPLTYSWEFGDGVTLKGVQVQREFTTPGVRTVRLVLNDGEATTTGDPIEIAVGVAPVASIDAPAASLVYHAGDTIEFSGSASDPDGGVLPPSAFAWEIYQAHENHLHPFASLSGQAAGSFVVPVDGHSPDHTHFRIELRVTDGDGLSTSVSRDIWPVVSVLQIDTEPSGISVMLEGSPLVTPAEYESIVNFQHTIEAPWVAWVDGRAWGFKDWGVSWENPLQFVAPEGGMSLTAHYFEYCVADLTLDQFVNGDDYDLFAGWFETGESEADLNQDGFVNGDDFDLFAEHFEEGC